PRSVRSLLLMREGVVAEGLDAELRRLHRDDVRDRALQRARRLRHAVVAERRDPDRSVVPTVRVTGDDVFPTLSAGPDVAELVDDVVVANVAPATRDRVEVIDGAD